MRRVIDRGDFILGADVDAFEAEFAAYCGARHCIGVSSGTSALQLALQAAGVGPGDEVILPVNTYIASALAVSNTGATPVLVDADATYGMTVQAAAAALTPRTKALMPVHLYGRLGDIERLAAFASANRLQVIEDACQAHGARRDGRHAGTFGVAGCFSFYPGKNLGAFGDGGAVITDDAAFAHEIRLRRDFGQQRKYEHLIKGDNCRLDTLQAAILRVKLGHLDEWNACRVQAAVQYDEQFAARGLEVPPRRRDGSDVYHLYVVEVEGRDTLRGQLESDGIETGVHYPTPIHRQPAYADLELGVGVFPRSEARAARLLSLPMFPQLRPADITRVVEAVVSARSLLKSA